MAIANVGGRIHYPKHLPNIENHPAPLFILIGQREITQIGGRSIGLLPQYAQSLEKWDHGFYRLFMIGRECGSSR